MICLKYWDKTCTSSPETYCYEFSILNAAVYFALFQLFKCPKSPYYAISWRLCTKACYHITTMALFHNGSPGPHGDLLGDLGPPFLYFRLLEVFAQNWVPFWSPFLEFSGPLDILEQCNGRDFNNECFQSIVIVKNGWGEFWPALRK